MPDFIHPADDAFDKFFDDFVKYLTEDSTAPARTAAQKKALTAALADWQRDYPAHLRAQKAADTARTTKDDTRDAVEAVIRKQSGEIQDDSATTDTQRTAAGLPIYKEGRTPSPEPESHPILRKVDTSTRLVLRLFFADAATPDRNAKPEGVAFCEVHARVGGDRPTDPASLPMLALESRSPYRADFVAGEEGKTVWLSFRWVNTRGEPGPWSPVYSAVVPG